MQKFIDDLFNAMSERFDGRIIRATVSKPNIGEVTAFSLKKEGSVCAPTIYAESYYDDYKTGYATVEEIAENILATAEASPNPSLDINFDELTDWEKVKDKVRPMVISAIGNEKCLEDLAYSKTKTDLVIIYQLEFVSDLGLQCIKIRKEAMKVYGITLTTLKNTAFKNLKEHVSFMNMAQVLASMMGIPEDEPMEQAPMWVLSNDTKQYGASAIFLPSVMKEVTTKMKTDQLYILPSSIHEVIILDATKPDTAGKTEDLKEMVREVNATQVAPKDKLSDHVYFYNGKTIEVIE